MLVGREIAGQVGEKMSSNPNFQKAQQRLKQAQDLVEALSHLKGAAMKVGQLLSLEMSDLLPPEVTDILRTLHDSATFLPFDQVKKILISELGEARFAMLENLSQEPIAAASIGQVHRARLQGKEVVLKIQYPLVAESIDTDLALLKKVIGGALAVKGSRISFDAVFTELGQGLKVETDYEQEAKSLTLYKQLFANFPHYVVPDVHVGFSTKKVLTLSYETGERLSDWIKKPHTPADRHDFAKRILDLLMLELFEFGVVQTDPNFGNFLVRDDGKTLVLLDFGAVRIYSPEMRRDIVRLLGTAVREERELFFTVAEEMKFLDPREAPEVKEQFFNLMNLIASMFKEQNQPFCFADEGYLSGIREKSWEFANSVKHTSPAHQIIFLNRKLGGMFHLLKDLDCRVDLSAYWRTVVP